MQVDYLIAGAGASGMAFLDTILTETDATVAIVDRRDAPGGHWNDAYPFVRLHQSSSFYGVSSKPLGQERECDRGYNAGLFDLAGKSEILHYYEDLMENTYLPSGRVHYFPMSEHVGDGVIRSLLSGRETRIRVAGKLVNAGIWGDLASIPLTHKRSFEVAEGVTCVPPNDLPQRAADFETFTVLGAGKTGMDTVLWLLSHGVEADRITWVRPNDYWIYCRDNIVPHPKFFDTTIASSMAELESLASAVSVDDHCANMESCGRWHRIDRQHRPTKFHAAVCSRAEIEALRSVRNVIRGRHVRRIETDRLHLETGSEKVDRTCLFVDCTARAGVRLGRDDLKVFDGDVINLFMVRPFQPVFSAALIAFIEATLTDEALRAQCTRITDFHDTPAEFVAVQRVGYLNQGTWNRCPEIKAWIDSCRLNAGSHLLAGLTAQDTEKLAMLGKMGPLTAQAVENISVNLAPSAA